MDQGGNGADGEKCQILDVLKGVNHLVHFLYLKWKKLYECFSEKTKNSVEDVIKLRCLLDMQVDNLRRKWIYGSEVEMKGMGRCYKFGSNQCLNSMK